MFWPCNSCIYLFAQGSNKNSFKNNVAEELQSSATDDVSSWSAFSTISYFTVAWLYSGHVECDADTISRTNRSSCLQPWSTSMSQSLKQNWQDISRVQSVHANLCSSELVMLERQILRSSAIVQYRTRSIYRVFIMIAPPSTAETSKALAKLLLLR